MVAIIALLASRPAGAAHAAHHGHAGGGEGLFNAFHSRGEFFLHGIHAALHAQAVVAVAQIAVGFGEHGFSSDDTISHQEQHGFDFVFVE